MYALKKINQVVDHQWHEIADHLPRIECFVEDENFPMRELAASIGSKVFYHLDEEDDALRLALDAGEHFNCEGDSQYVLTLVHRCIDTYTAKRVAIHEKKDENVAIDPRMESIVDRKFNQCFNDGKYK